MDPRPDRAAPALDTVAPGRLRRIQPGPARHSRRCEERRAPELQLGGSAGRFAKPARGYSLGPAGRAGSDGDLQRKLVTVLRDQFGRLVAPAVEGARSLLDAARRR